LLLKEKSPKPVSAVLDDQICYPYPWGALCRELIVERSLIFDPALDDTYFPRISRCVEPVLGVKTDIGIPLFISENWHTAAKLFEF
jgi:hypothetical protein